MDGITHRIKAMQQRLMATDINGCITGSSLTGHDFDQWSVTPDIDVFCYSPFAMVHAIDVCEYQLGLEPGGDEDSTTQGGDRLDEFVRRLGGRKMSVSGLLENIARQHLEIYSEDFEQWRKL